MHMYMRVNVHVNVHVQCMSLVYTVLIMCRYSSIINADQSKICMYTLTLCSCRV